MDTDRLTAELKDADLRVRLDAIGRVRALAGEPLPDSVLGALVGCVGADSKTVQRRAIDAIAEISATGDVRIVELLRAAISREARRARWGAAYALGQIGQDAFTIQVADAIVEALAGEDGDVRWAAAELIVRLGRESPAEIRERLLALAATGNPNARKMALYCIRDLGWSGADLLRAVELAVHDPDLHVRLAALSVLTRLDGSIEAAAAIMLECLQSDPDAGARRAAAAALGNLRGGKSILTRTVDAIREALRNAAATTSDDSMRRAAESALARLEQGSTKKDQTDGRRKSAGPV